MKIKPFATIFGAFFLHSGCSINGVGMVDVQHYENITIYMVKMEAWGGHLSTNSADAGITLRHAKRLYLYAKRDGGTASVVGAFIAQLVDDVLMPTDMPLSPETGNERAIAWMTDNGGLTIDLNGNKIGLTLGIQSRRVIKLPREFSGWLVIRHGSDGMLRVYYRNERRTGESLAVRAMGGLHSQQGARIMEFQKPILTGVAAGVFAAVASGTCLATGQFGFKEVFTRPDEGGRKTVKVYQAKNVTLPNGEHPYLFITSLKINTDGALISYHQDDPTGNRCKSNPGASPCAINNIRNAYRNHTRPVSEFTAIRNAGYPIPRTWKVLSSHIIEKNKTTGKPCITRNGYLVSMTADVAVPGGFNKVGDCDPSKWIDALTMPAIVLPKKPSQFNSNGIKMRSLVVAVSGGPSHRTVPGIVGDLGPSNEIGEANIAMNRELNGLAANDRPKHRTDAVRRFQAGPTAILMFPGKEFRLGRPITGNTIATAGAKALMDFGGGQKLLQCIHKEIDPKF